MEIERETSLRLLLQGIIGGLIAGLVFLLADMVIASALGMPLLAPLTTMSSIVLGPQAMAPTFPMVTAVIVGLLVHGVLSSIYGIVFAYLLAVSRQLAASVGFVVAYGFVYGAAIWVLNFLTRRSRRWPQFTMVDQLWMGFVPHAIFFGLPLAGYLLSMRESIVPVRER
ncbi:MAG: hypothetical protein M1358_22250 [Chloroflexi bacterium]|nr:hypothetical protein [Chloroflexota bacterium]